MTVEQNLTLNAHHPEMSQNWMVLFVLSVS
jgi:hypothetical protein